MEGKSVACRDCRRGLLGCGRFISVTRAGCLRRDPGTPRPGMESFPRTLALASFVAYTAEQLNSISTMTDSFLANVLNLIGSTPEISSGRDGRLRLGTTNMRGKYLQQHSYENCLFRSFRKEVSVEVVDGQAVLGSRISYISRQMPGTKYAKGIPTTLHQHHYHSMGFDGIGASKNAGSAASLTFSVLKAGCSS